MVAGRAASRRVAFFVIWRFYWWQESVQEAAKQSPYPLAPARPRNCRPSRGWSRSTGWPAWRVPTSTKRLAAQEKALNSYGPTAEKGFVHIPIQQAIKAVAGKLPVRKQPPGQSRRNDSGLMDSGESNSGRMFRGGRTMKTIDATSHPCRERRCWLCSVLAALPTASPWRVHYAACEPPGRCCKKVGFDQRLNEQVPLDLAFTDENGQGGEAGRLLRQEARHPGAGLLPVPMLCTLVLNGLTQGHARHAVYASARSSTW